VPPPPMADVAAASIVLGSNQDRDARPSRAAVAVPGFSMMTREVTVAEFQAGCAKGVFGGCIGWTGPMEGQALDHPVVGVTFGQAEAWCESQGMRLPTESEWELAARGSAGRSYPWGDEWKAGAANYCDVGCAADARVVHNEDDGFPKTAPAGQFTAGATPEGIADLVGNAAEWTLDCWTSDHRARTDWKPSSEACGKRVVRGGDWTGWAHHQTGWRRFAWGNEQRSERIGFRCVRGEPVGG
jgi:iron(II)-dependent oxidoreductase